MNKKVMLLVYVLAIVTLLIPYISIVQAKKTVIVYEQSPYDDPSTLLLISEEPGDVFKISGDGHVVIRSGTIRTYIYDGPLGVGTCTQETIISVTSASGDLVDIPNLGLYPTFAVGHGIYKFTLTITDGPWEGTVWGHGNVEWEWDFSGFPRYDAWGTYHLKHGNGDFEGVKVDIEDYFTLGNLGLPLPPPATGTWHLRTTVTSPK